jgi:hypothetical protein
MCWRAAMSVSSRPTRFAKLSVLSISFPLPGSSALSDRTQSSRESTVQLSDQKSPLSQPANSSAEKGRSPCLKGAHNRAHALDWIEPRGHTAVDPPRS